jgi:hypothetical protein
MTDKAMKNLMRDILAKNSEGESLSFEEYELLTKYWVNAREIVEIYPAAFGHGTLHYVINKADECEAALKRRKERLKRVQ